jgi:hypothetical protein
MNCPYCKKCMLYKTIPTQKRDYYVRMYDCRICGFHSEILLDNNLKKIRGIDNNTIIFTCMWMLFIMFILLILSRALGWI